MFFFQASVSDMSMYIQVGHPLCFVSLQCKSRMSLMRKNKNKNLFSVLSSVKIVLSASILCYTYQHLGQQINAAQNNAFIRISLRLYNFIRPVNCELACFFWAAFAPWQHTLNCGFSVSICADCRWEWCPKINISTDSPSFRPRSF